MILLWLYTVTNFYIILLHYIIYLITVYIYLEMSTRFNVVEISIIIAIETTLLYDPIDFYHS